MLSRKIIAFICALALSAGLSGCSGIGGGDNSSQTSIKAREGVLKTKDSEAEVEEENIYVPDISVNFDENNASGWESYNLSQFTIVAKEESETGYGYAENEVEYNYDVSDLKLEKLVTDLNLNMDEYYSTITSTDEFYFTAIGYTGKVKPASRDSVFPVEIEINNEVVDEYDITNISNYKVKGIKLTDNLIVDEDYEIRMLNGELQFGMTREDVKKAFGDGFEGADASRIYYKVMDATLVVEFSSNVVDTVYYIKN